MMNIVNGYITVARPGRSIKIQRFTQETYFTALRAFGASETVAMAATRNLITISLKGK
jgi:hypothetical protein